MGAAQFLEFASEVFGAPITDDLEQGLASVRVAESEVGYHDGFLEVDQFGLAFEAPGSFGFGEAGGEGLFEQRVVERLVEIGRAHV